MTSDLEVDESAFLAGMLGQLGGLCALAMPFEDSYKRVTDRKSRGRLLDRLGHGESRLSNPKSEEETLGSSML